MREQACLKWFGPGKECQSAPEFDGRECQPLMSSVAATVGAYPEVPSLSEPTLSLTHGKEYFSVAVPFALYRVAYKNEPATRLGDPSPGLATIAGWQLVISYTHQF